MGFVEVLTGTAVITFVMLYIAFNLKAEEDSSSFSKNMIAGMKLFLILAAVSFLIYIPKSVVDGDTACKSIEINETLNVGPMNTTNTFDICVRSADNNDTANAMYGSYILFFRIFLGFMALHVLLSIVFTAINGIKKKMKQKNG